MERKIMVEVTEQELKELNKEKTLDDYVDGLINCLGRIVPDKKSCDVDATTNTGVINKLYETQKYRMYVTETTFNETLITIEKKKEKIR